MSSRIRSRKSRWGYTCGIPYPSVRSGSWPALDHFAAIRGHAAILDGVPESVALGVSLSNGHGTGLLMAGAIFLPNLPEAISSVPGLLREGYSRRWIYGIWSATSLLLIVIVVASHACLRALSPETEGVLKGFAAGSILSMLANSMIPEAYHEGGFFITPMTILGFAVAFVLAKLGPGV